MKIMFLGLLFALLAGCAPRPLVQHRDQRTSPMELSFQNTFEQCEEAADRFDASDSFSMSDRLEDRPDFGFPNQVMSSDELVDGGMYVWCNVFIGKSIPIGLISNPYKYENPYDNPNGIISLKVDIIYLESGNPTSWFLSNMGVVPYPDGKWNPAIVILYLL